MIKKYFACNCCEAEIPDEKPEFCPICGRREFDEIEREFEITPEDKKYHDKYEEVIKKLEEYTEDTEPEDIKYSFAD